MVYMYTVSRVAGSASIKTKAAILDTLRVTRIDVVSASVLGLLHPGTCTGLIILLLVIRANVYSSRLSRGLELSRVMQYAAMYINIFNEILKSTTDFFYFF